MSGTSSKSTRISIRLPNDLVRTLNRRINGRRSRWVSVGEYIKERLIYDLERSHGNNRKGGKHVKEVAEQQAEHLHTEGGKTTH